MNEDFPAGNCGLVVVDLQEKLIPAIHEGEQVVSQARRMILFARLLRMPLFLTEQWPQKLGPTVRELQAIPGLPTPLSKTSFSAADILPSHLPETVWIIGVETHVCIRQTVFDLLKRHHRPIVLADAVGSRRPLDRDIALQEMRSAHVTISTVEAQAFQILGNAEHPLFQEALRLFK